MRVTLASINKYNMLMLHEGVGKSTKLKTLEHHLHICHDIDTQLLCCLPFLIYWDAMEMDDAIYISPYTYGSHCFEIWERSKPQLSQHEVLNVTVKQRKE